MRYFSNFDILHIPKNFSLARQWINAAHICLLLTGTRRDIATSCGTNGGPKLSPYCGLPCTEQVLHWSSGSLLNNECYWINKPWFLHACPIIVCMCLCSGNLDKQTAKGSTALHYCCLTDNSECMKLLLRGKASVSISKSFNKACCFNIGHWKYMIWYVNMIKIV